MGGVGSGTATAWDKKEVVEDYLVLCASKLKRDGLLLPSTHLKTSLSWRDGMGKQVASVGYTLDTENASYIQLRYQKGDSTNYRYNIVLTTTQPHYGGIRYWFSCPNVKCQKRVAKLYLSSNYFLCRHCLDLTYTSSQSSQPFRWLHKAQKIHQRLGGDGIVDLIPPKPKHMHQQTYQRLVDEMQSAHQTSLSAAMAKFGEYYTGG